jgi:holo-[acyl-carrier protein] synthase
MITLPGEVDGHRVRVGCDVVAVEDARDSLATFGERCAVPRFLASASACVPTRPAAAR